MRRKGFTLIELLVVIAIIALLIAILLPALGQARSTSKAVKCSTQIRSVLQGMITWSNSHKDLYPLPSKVDVLDLTVNEGQVANPSFGTKKDITRHIMSLMIFNGLITPETLICPGEANLQFQKITKYQYDSPSQADGPDKSQALWDPAFTSTPADDLRFGRMAGDPAGCSYAHIPPYNKQGRKWSPAATSINPSNSTSYAIFGDRGPVYVGTPPTGWTLLQGSKYGTGSFTLKTHGGGSDWKGNIGYSDGRVVFEPSSTPAHMTFTFKSLTGQTSWPDNFFVNELDKTGTQKPANPPPVADNTPPDSGGFYVDSDGGDMTTAYLRPIIHADWTTKTVPTMFAD